jgi:hypothetical protein
VSRVLTEPIPPAPTFAEDLAQVAVRVQKLVRKVPAPHVSHRLHPLVARLLDQDERRRQAREKSSYPLLSDAPVFDTPFARRHLRILNALFLALQRAGARPLVRDREGRDTAVEVGRQSVSFVIERIGEIRESRPSARPGMKVQRKPGRPKLRLTIGAFEAGSRGKSWEDSADAKLEQWLTEIVVELFITGETNYRAGALAAHEWWLQRRAELEEEARRQREEAARRERERLAKLERERVEALLKEAENWRRAADLRSLVEAVRTATVASDPGSAVKLDRWANSVLALADRIDPVRAGRLPTEATDN